MKKVQEKELRELISRFYREFVVDVMISDLEIKVFNTYIYVKDYTATTYEKKKQICDFAEKIEELSFGNLKVAFMNNDEGHSWMYISNNYDIIGN